MEGLHHRFAVILAADCAEYCRQVEENAEQAVAALKKCKTEFDRCVIAHQGRAFGCVGDSLMAEFPSPIEALRAARDFQASNQSRQSTDASANTLQFRTGLHEGDVLAENGNLYGDVVNIAARLQELAAPGGIVVSSLVREQVHKEPGLFFKPLGSHVVKNIDEPVTAYDVRPRDSRINWRRIGFKLKEYRPAYIAVLVILAGFSLIYWYDTTHPRVSGPINVEAGAPSATSEKSIAVLPFGVCEERSSDRPLARGLTVEVRNRLARRNSLTVMGRRTSETLAESDLSVRKKIELMNIEYVLSGTLCRDGLDLTLYAELTDNAGFIIWANDLRQSVNQFGQVEMPLAALVDNAVGAKLGDAIASPLDKAIDRRALEQLLIGREHRQQEAFEKARAALEEALEIQPDYAEAMWQLAELNIDSEWGHENVVDGYKRARPVLDKALDLALAQLERDPKSFDANRVAGEITQALGNVENELAYRDFHETGEEVVSMRRSQALLYYADAERYYRAALAANPSSTYIRISLVATINRLDAQRRKESLEILMQGLETDPFNAKLSEFIAFRLVEFGRLREAMEQLDRFRVMPQGKRGVWWAQLEILNNTRQFDEQLRCLIEIMHFDPMIYEDPLPAMGHLWRLSGWTARLGLYDEAASLYATVLEIPFREEDYPFWRPWLEDYYLRSIGRGDEVARRRVEKIASLSNEEILKAWFVELDTNTWVFWEAGQRDRAIELLEAMQHWRYPQSRWADRQMSYASWLVEMYMQEGREDDAAPVLQKIVDHLQAEVDIGVRHPQTLMRLAAAYGWQRDSDKALEILDLAIDYGGHDMAMCCTDYAPLLAQDYAYDKKWWDGLEGDPRFIASRSRMRAHVDQQRANIRSLLRENDVRALLAPVMAPAQAAASE